MCTTSLSCPLLILGFLHTSLKPTQEGWGGGHSHIAEKISAVAGTVTILSGGGSMAPTGCTFRLATGRVEKKKNKKNNKKKKANEKLADKVSEKVEAMQLE
ncbi:hypothetical protein FDENT_9486 [Fusarium denticulatum]|uniref:Uncharacterized protein n=1 Tax=Fusarium denticulatum TaxID=48507 RepID=A0A8H5TWG2_9HYPO|nr:hypothetical protein FDENT_9486 [Fusarium denticulatum]